MTERILCASIHFDDGKIHEHQPKNIKTGFVICGRRHHNCYTSLQAIAKTLGIGNENALKLIERSGRDVQGFINNLDRHVDRKEGYYIAKAAGQIVYGAGMEDKDNPMLISENLY